MTHRGVILYGPPASGKDAVTEALCARDSTFCHYVRLKVGTGRTAGYEVVTDAEVSALRRRGEILYENTRYGNRYFIDRPRLTALFREGRTPIVHVGQVAGVRAVRAYSATWLSVLLWCPREVTKQRAADRGSHDVYARLLVWDETVDDIKQHGTADFDLRIDTEQHRPEDAAQMVCDILRSRRISNAG